MYIQLPTPDKKCSKCGAINQTESVRRSKGFGRTSVVLRCTVCGHEKVEAEESVSQTTDDHGHYVYNTAQRPDVETF